MPLDRALALFRRIAEGVAYCHDNGVVHRDLKPENILVRPDGQPVIIDFGLALTKTAHRVTYANLSATAGTPDYMAPEQIEGQRGDAAHRPLRARDHPLRDALGQRRPFPATTAWRSWPSTSGPRCRDWTRSRPASRPRWRRSWRAACSAGPTTGSRRRSSRRGPGRPGPRSTSPSWTARTIRGPPPSSRPRPSRASPPASRYSPPSSLAAILLQALKQGIEHGHAREAYAGAPLPRREGEGKVHRAPIHRRRGDGQEPHHSRRGARRSLVKGIWFDGSCIEGYARVAESDMYLMPDPSTFAMIPWRSGKETVARLICNVHTPDDQPFGGDPRAALIRAGRGREAARSGVPHEPRDGVLPIASSGAVAGTDGLSRGAGGLEGALIPHDSAGYFDAPSDEVAEFRSDLMSTLALLRHRGRAPCTTRSPAGQHEVDFLDAPALAGRRQHDHLPPRAQGDRSAARASTAPSCPSPSRA